MVLVGFNYSEWLINDSWSTAMCFRTFWDRPEMRPNLDPRTPYLPPQCLNKYKKIMGTTLKHVVRIWEYEVMQFVEGLCSEHFECFIFWFVGHWAIWNFEILTIGNWQFGDWKVSTWTVLNWKNQIGKSQLESFQI